MLRENCMNQFDLVIAQVAIVLRWLGFKGYKEREAESERLMSRAFQGSVIPWIVLSDNRAGRGKPNLPLLSGLYLPAAVIKRTPFKEKVWTTRCESSQIRRSNDVSPFNALVRLRRSPKTCDRSE